MTVRRHAGGEDMADEQSTRTTISLRPGRLADAKACGRICFEAFGAIAAQHNFPPDFPSADVATDLMTMLLSHPRFFSVVAELDGTVVGSNFLDERSPVAGLGPITVDPKVQNLRIGRRLMQAALDQVSEPRLPGVRLLQAAYHGRSLALYTTLGFQPREAIACMQGRPIGASVAGYRVRRAGGEDAEACGRGFAFFPRPHPGGGRGAWVGQGAAG